jgi:hypothetical protein
MRQLMFFLIVGCLLGVASALGGGNGTVAGHAYAFYRGREHPSNNETVDLLSVNAYTTKIVQGLLAGRAMRSDASLTKYRRSTTSDSSGDFVIHHVPPGDYYVISAAEWEHRYAMENADDTGTDEVTADYKKYIFARINVRVGGTMRVSQWNQNCPEVGPPFAHG